MFDKNGAELQFHQLVKSEHGTGLIQGRAIIEIGDQLVERVIVSYNPHDPNVSQTVRDMAASPRSVWVLVYHLPNEIEIEHPTLFRSRSRHQRILAEHSDIGKPANVRHCPWSNGRTRVVNTSGITPNRNGG